MVDPLKSGDIARQLAVTKNTIRRWVHRYPAYFSEEALSGTHRYYIYTPEEFNILASIHQLSATGYSLEVIEQKLAEGYRYEGLLSELKPIEYPSPASRESKAIKALEEMLVQAQERINELTEKLTETQYRLGVAEGKLEALKEMYRK